MNSSKPSRKFYIVVLTGANNYVLSERFAFNKARKDFEGKFAAADEEQTEAIRAAGFTNERMGQSLVILRRADARKMLAAMKAEGPEWARDYSPVLREVGEFVRHRDPRPIINWRVQVSKAPEGSTVKVGTVMANGFVTRDKARAYAKRSAESDKVYTTGFEYEVLPNYGNI
ncbi:hypothetical protein IVIADoCa7_17 [Xanthomonas phage vB_Xar_IVIA-DoCa7]|uniref:Uncharacterized protein n=1 Tax=Xanthomonas phage vB_Xar_IVIA-DoCa7 TaxID=2975534 RepID=A0A9X9NYI1_9CAUD|nr:hypothetical protein IVIADoCa7_17 [Xanthomonas phage vB_Xar_IVIA-DoCa7]